MDGVQGSGHYVGTSLAWTTASGGWWGEGEVKFYLDGDEHPSICDTGTEDYFNTAWCPAEVYHAPYHGITLAGGGASS